MIRLVKMFLKKIIINFIARTSELEPDARDKYLETTELSYLFSIFNLFLDSKQVPGHILELGVGAGRNAILFGKMLKIINQDGGAKYFGFDTFGSYTEKDLRDNPSLSRLKWAKNSYKFVDTRIRRHKLHNVCSLIKGDIRTTLPDFIKGKFNHKASGHLYCRLIYIDTSAYEPAKLGLHFLWDLLLPGGILAIDQRTQGGEWAALKEFCEEKKVMPLTQEFYNGAPAILRKSA